MAKKDFFSIDTSRVSTSINTFDSKKKIYNSAYTKYKGSYLKTAGNVIVKKMRSNVDSLYKEIGSLYNGLSSFVTDYIESVKKLEESLKNGTLSGDKEANVRGIVNSLNSMLDGSDPTDLYIDPKTGDVSLAIMDKVHYGGAWDGATLNERFMDGDVDPSKISNITGMNLSRNGQEVIEGSADKLTKAYVYHPKLTSFVQGLSPVSLEVVFSAKYNDKQLEKVKTIKTKNAGWETVGTISGFVLAGGGAKGLFKGGKAFATGAKILASEGLGKALGTISGKIAGKFLVKDAVEVAGKNIAKMGFKDSFKHGAKVTLIENVRIFPLTHGYSLRDSYDMDTRKINGREYAAFMAENIVADLGVMALGKGAKAGFKYIKNSKYVQSALLKLEDFSKLFEGYDKQFLGKGRNVSLSELDVVTNKASLPKKTASEIKIESVVSDISGDIDRIDGIERLKEYISTRDISVIPEKYRKQVLDISEKDLKSFVQEHDDMMTLGKIVFDLDQRHINNPFYNGTNGIDSLKVFISKDKYIVLPNLTEYRLKRMPKETIEKFIQKYDDDGFILEAKDLLDKEFNKGTLHYNLDGLGVFERVAHGSWPIPENNTYISDKLKLALINQKNFDEYLSVEKLKTYGLKDYLEFNSGLGRKDAVSLREIVRIVNNKDEFADFANYVNGFNNNFKHDKLSYLAAARQIVEELRFRNRRLGLSDIAETRLYNISKGLDDYMFACVKTPQVDDDVFKKSVIELSEFFERNSANGAEYGVDQHITANHSITMDPSYKALRNKLMLQGYSKSDASMILKYLDRTGACSYADACNLIFYQFRNNEKTFKKIFGYDMYKIEKNGSRRLNAEELLVDLYTWANDTANGGNLIENKKIIDKSKLLKVLPLKVMNTENQVYISDGYYGLNDYTLTSFMKSKDVSIDVYTRQITDTRRTEKKFSDSEFDLLVNRVKKAIVDGESLGLGIHSGEIKNISMINEKIFDSISFSKGGHAVAITGVKENCFVVSSWGRKYYIPFSDLKNGGSFAINSLRLGY